MNYFAGVDIGSTAIKTVLIDEKGAVVGRRLYPTGSHYHQNTQEALGSLLRECSVNREEVCYMMATGYGRKLFREADETISEISANAVGAAQSAAEGETIRTIINIGGQDSKIIVLDDDGHVKNFVMNDKCAAGTGRFLDMTARNLGLDLQELGVCHLHLEGVPLSINSTCTVFAESEIISLLAKGHDKSEIVAGVHYSIARRIARLAGRAGVEDGVLFDGGPALNQGLAQALEDTLMRPLMVPLMPQFTTALGAAHLARSGAAFEAREVCR